MLPIQSAANRLVDAGGLEQRTMQIELPDTDATEVESITLQSMPRLGPGDRVLIKSGAADVYRKVNRVEPIAGGAALVWLDAGYIIRLERGDKLKLK